MSDEVYSRPVLEILTGGLPAEAPLPSERELALAFRVNRHAIREALKRLQQSGLVRITHGGKTRVRDWRSNDGLEALSALVAAGVAPNGILRDVAVMRRTIGSDAALACAAGADEGEVARGHRCRAGLPTDPGRRPRILDRRRRAAPETSPTDWL